jgi:uncharacterized protein (DUF4415 family)
MRNTKNKDYEYLETSEEASKRGLKRITRPAFLGEPKKKENKKAITIMLDPDIIEYFKKQTEGTTTGYQTLINQTLREKIDGSQTDIKADELIERLLQDKTALIRLKAELEME